MSKVPKWKAEKTKVKVVFRLQFHATHIPLTGWDKLFLSFIPADTGKPSAKTNKANVRNGNCKWPDPIYEATRLLLDSRSKKYDDKFYKLIIAMGTSRASILGEADINLAEFVDALKPCSVALPLHGCDFGTVLHVTVQILTTKTGFREFEQQSFKGSQIIPGQGSSDTSDDKVNTRIRLRENCSELPSVEELTESTEDYDDSAAGVDGSSHTSDSLTLEKTEIPLFPNKPDKEEFHPNRLTKQGSNDWGAHGWASDYSADNDLTLAYEENSRLRVRLEVAESAFLQLKSEAKSLQRITDELGVETQGLACQLSGELDSGHKLAREVSVLKDECSSLKRNVLELKSTNPSYKAMLIVESKLREIRDKICLGFRANDSGFDSDFEVLQCAIDSVKQGIQNQGKGPESSDQLMNQEKMCELLQKLEDSKTENEILVKKMNQMERYYESFIHQLEESQRQTVKESERLREEHSSSAYTISLLQSQIEKLHEETNLQMMKFVEERMRLETLNKELERRAVASETALKRVRWNYSVAVERLQKDLELLSFQVLSMYESNETLAKQPFAADSSYPEDVDIKQVNSKSPVYTNGNGCTDYHTNTETQRNNRVLSRGFDFHASMEDELLDMHLVTVQLGVFSDVLVGALNHANSEVSRVRDRVCELELQVSEFTVARESLVLKLRDSLDQAKSLKESEMKYGAKFDDLTLRIKILEAKLQDVTEERVKFEGLVEKESMQKSNLETEIGAMKVNFVNKLKRAELDLEVSRTKLESSVKLVEKLERELQEVTEKLRISSEDKERCVNENRELLSRLESLQVELQQVTDERMSLIQALEECGSFKEEFERTKSVLMSCKEENKTLENELQSLREVKVSLESSFKKAKSDLETSATKLDFATQLNENLQQELQEMNEKFKISSEAEEKQAKANTELLSRLELLELELQEVTSESKDLMQSLQDSGTIGEELESTKINLLNSREENRTLENELHNLREVNTSLESSLKKAQSDLEDSKTELDFSSKLVEKLQNELQEVTEKFKVSSDTEERLVRENEELLSRVEFLQVELQQVSAESKDLMQKLEEFQSVREDLESTDTNLETCKEEIVTLESELQVVREMKDNLEISLRKAESDLEASGTKLDFSGKVIENLQNELQELTEKFKNSSEAEEIHAEANRELLLKIEFLEIELQQASEEIKGLIGKLQVSDSASEELECNKGNLENELIGLTETLSCTHDELQTEKGLREELESALTDLNLQLDKKEQQLISFYGEKTELRRRIVDLEKANISMQHLLLCNEGSERKLEQEFENQLVGVLEKLLASDTEASYMRIQLQELLHWLERNSHNNQEKHRYESEILRLNEMLNSTEEEMDLLRFSKEELEITNIIFRLKLEEQYIIVSTELGDLKDKQNELIRRLSEQTLKTEEYKNLSIHLRELKEKAETEISNHAIEKKETESLRIAFIKEQYETKIQELKNQMQVSKKYAEEMLVKLQNTLDEVESGRKNEISLAKRIEELSVKISEMEIEMQEVRTDRRELAAAYDNIKTELECNILSFDCCKEEKAKLEACFQECNEERRKIKVELDLVKRLMENMALAENGKGNESLHDNNNSNSNNGGSSIGDILEDGGMTVINANSLSSQAPESCGKESDREMPLENNGKEDSSIQEHIKEQQNLKIRLNLFQKELEKLKNENLSSLIPLEGEQTDPSLHGLERALSQLDLANEHLGNIFPSFKELSGSGNALERVLALELELAEALHSKKQTDLRFQSSFLKQHNDEEAVFQSFRDINELIQDMLELKKRHVTVESELKEMQGRYSQLSLQFAEVEGERQKLMMSLKNRSPRKLY